MPTATRKKSQECSTDNMICEAIDRPITLTYDDNRKCNDILLNFVNTLSKRGQSHQYYEENRGTNARKAARDNFLGKKAEVLVAMYLRDQRQFPKIAVDVEIREGAGKKWKVDLPYSEIVKGFPGVHVKACLESITDLADDYTWTFQWSNKSGKGGKDDIFNGPDTDLVAFVTMKEPEDPVGIIRAIMPWGEVFKMLRDPRVESLKGMKVCVYYKDLKGAADRKR